MMDIPAIKRYSADKIALLGLFAVGLAVAGLITSARTTRPMRRGAAAVAAIKSEGLEEILDNQGWEAYYFIKDGEGRLVGFSTEIFERAGGYSNSTITSKARFFIRRPYVQENLLLFECDERLDTFTVEMQVRTLGKKVSASIVSLDSSGRVTVTDSVSGEKISIEAKKNSVPEYLIERIAVAATAGREGKVVLNVIGNDGVQDVVVVSTEKMRQASPRLGGKGRIVEIHSPEQQYMIQILLDSADRIAEIITEHQFTLIQVRASREEIIGAFGEVGLFSEQDEALESEAI